MWQRRWQVAHDKLVAGGRMRALHRRHFEAEDDARFGCGMCLCAEVSGLPAMVLVGSRQVGHFHTSDCLDLVAPLHFDCL